MKSDYQYYREATKALSMPFAYVDLDRLDDNIARIAERSQGKNIRVAAKSVRSVSLIKRILASADCFKGVMCFSPFEALYLHDCGMKDILMGYPVWDSRALGEIAEATQKGANITLMIDSVAHLKRIESVITLSHTTIPVCLDMDMSMDVPGLHFGVYRSPIITVEDAKPVLDYIQQSDKLTFAGMMGYEAQIAGVGDHYPKKAMKNMVVQQLKRSSIKRIAAKRAAMIEEIEQRGMSYRLVNGGGTGSLFSTREEAVITEVTVGSGFYSPGLFDLYRDFHYEPAAGFAIEIVRRPKAGMYTCFGGGYVASGAAGDDRLPTPFLPEGVNWTGLEGVGEVQTPITYQGEETLKLGDPVFMRHAKAGELCERFETLHCLSNGKIVDHVTTYRGDGKCFL